MKKSRLEPGGKNIFQEIKATTAAAEKSGKKIIRLSIGQPQGPALLSARKAAAKAVLSSKESMHEYQDNGSPGVPDFAKRFVQAHVKRKLRSRTDLAFLPIPGIKSMLGLIIRACGSKSDEIFVATTDPGYAVAKTWCGYLGVKNHQLALTPENGFLFSIEDIPKGVKEIIINYPNNPSGKVAPRRWLEELCKCCEGNNIRLVNDAAYAMLVHSKAKKNYSTLTDVAINYPDLSWLELFSASKAIGNGTGWRVGAVVGSKDFVEDLATIKGNSDSGFVAPMAAGALYAMENDQKGISRNSRLYEKRLKILISILTSHGMRLAVQPEGTFFSLWEMPSFAFGHGITDASHFNTRMIEETGIVGVPFGSYIRYSVAGFPVEKNQREISDAFAKAQISYNI